MSETQTRSAWNGFNQDIIDQFRANGGNILRGQFTGRALLLLTTTGAKSGRPFTSPLAFTRDGDAYVVIASKGGAPTNPDWYHNLVANTEVKVEVGTESFDARARVTAGEERERLFAAQAALMPGFADYQRKTSRQIPVVVLERVA
ncbi:MAG TPA: nitroreductase family deazaflavin-dependent oxidoreductase [Chloroflexota bacterium]|jgi:deazaflavin-dependent oxidoreductase (nitroreductase family)